MSNLDPAIHDSGFRRPRRLPSELARVLEAAIIYRDIEPGTRLIEEEIALRHGVSRSPVREALRLLEYDGLAIREAKGGVRVAELSRADLDEVYACRVVLEGLAAEQAARRRGDEDLAALAGVFREMKQAGDAADVRRYFRLNVALTGTIRNATGNRTLIRFLSIIDKQAQRYRYMAYVKAPELIALSLEGNQEILEAIAQGKAKPARDVTARLIRRSWRVIAAHLGASIAP